MMFLRRIPRDVLYTSNVLQRSLGAISIKNLGREKILSSLSKLKGAKKIQNKLTNLIKTKHSNKAVSSTERICSISSP